MAAIERPLSTANLLAELAKVQSQLELVDANENVIERTIQRDELMEYLDWLQDEIATTELDREG